MYVLKAAFLGSQSILFVCALKKFINLLLNFIFIIKSYYGVSFLETPLNTILTAPSEKIIPS